MDSYGELTRSTPTIESTFFPENTDPFKYYQKREEGESNLDDLLKEKQYLVISGPPGQGKSTFASHYIKSKSEYEGCLAVYIPASSETIIKESFRAIATRYKIKGIENTEDALLKTILLETLSDQGKYNNTDVILCFDNVEKYEEIKMYLSNLPKNIRALITTRDPTVFPEEYVFKLPPFNKQESLEYLNKNLPSKFRGTDQLEKLIAEVGDKYGNTTPYHMNKTVAWFKVNSVGTTIDDYIKDIRTYKAEGEEEPETKMLLDFLNKSENHTESWKLLQYASYLDPDFINAQILSELLDLSDVKGLNNLVPSLQKLSLIDKVENDLGKEGFMLHRLVQKTTRNYMKKHKDNPKVPTLTNEEIQEKLIKTLNDLMPMVDRSTKKWGEAAKSYKHVEKLLKEIDFGKLPSEDKTVLKELSSLLTKAGHYNLYATSTYKQSLEYYKQALQLDKAIYGKNHPSVAISYNDLGLTYAQLGEHEKALECHEKTLQIMRGVLGENHPNVATSYNNVGLTYGRLGNQEKALECHEKALQIRLQVLPENHPDVAQSYNNVGYAYGQLGDHEKALEYGEKALKIWLEALGENHPDVATSYNNVGYAYGQLGEHEKALEYQEKALDIRLEALGEKHPSVATSYNNVGYTYGQLGDHAKALGYLEKGLQICEERFGNSPNSLYAKTLKNIAFQHKSLSNNGEALKYYKQSYEMFNSLENKANFAKDLQNIESEIAILEELVLNTQDNDDDAVSSIDSIIPDDDSAKDETEAGVLGEVPLD